MSFATFSKPFGYSMLAVCALLLGTAFAADHKPATTTADPAFAAIAASQQIDRDLQRSAGILTQELDQSFKQAREAERFGIPRSLTNTYGSEESIDQEMTITASQANAQLQRAAKRDEYMYQRNLMETERSAYPTDSSDYARFTKAIQELDRNFSQNAQNVN